MEYQQTSKTTQPQPQTQKSTPFTVRGGSPKSAPFNQIMLLQRTLGNRAIGRLIQRQFTIGVPGDKYNQEVDHVAEQVRRMPEPTLSQKMMVSGQANEKHIQGFNPNDKKRLHRQSISKKEESAVSFRRNPGSTRKVSPKVESQIDGIRGGGQPLPQSIRAYFEPRFGRDFSQVRVHNDEHTDELSHALGARAFTVGQEIMFGQGQYLPSSAEGRELLAHELTHTIQQTHKLSPRVQRRAFTAQEHAIGRHIDEVATEASTEAMPYSGPMFTQRLRDFKTDLAAQISAIPPGTSDPDRLLATLWTLHAWTTVPSSYAQSRAISSSLPVRDLSSGDYKCNRFVGDAYAIGASRGYAEHGAGGAYPTGQSSWWDPRSPYPPSANELGSTSAATGNLTNLPVTSSPQPGDIIAFPYPGGIGHSGINLGHDIYISARHSTAHPARTKQVDDGIQVTNIPQLSVQYREFRP